MKKSFILIALCALTFGTFAKDGHAPKPKQSTPISTSGPTGGSPTAD